MTYMTNGCAAVAQQWRAEDDLSAAIQTGNKIDSEIPAIQAKALTEAAPKIIMALVDQFDVLIEKAENADFLTADAWENNLATHLSEALKDAIHDHLWRFETISKMAIGA